MLNNSNKVVLCVVERRLWTKLLAVDALGEDGVALVVTLIHGRLLQKK